MASQLTSVVSLMTALVSLSIGTAWANDPNAAAIANQAQQIMGNPVPLVGEGWKEQAERARAAVPAADLERMLDQANTIQIQGNSETRVDLLNPEAPIPDAFPMSQEPNGDMMAAMQPAERITWVFISEAMGDDALNAAFELAAGAEDVALVYRGIRDGERLVDAIARIHKLAAQYDPVPNISIDPTAFERFGATAAPEIVVEEGGQVIARARGILDPETVKARIASGQKGDLGDLGPVVAFSERDLIQVMQETAAGLDMEAMKQKALGRFWERVEFHKLPTVTEDRVRTIDPSIRITQDLRTHDGQLIHAAGTLINPLDMQPFDRRLIIFNASDKRQVATAARLLRESRKARTILIATELDRAQGWDALREIQNGFQAPVFLLQPDVRDRFMVEAVPTMIEASGRAFIVTELTPDEGVESGTGMSEP